MHIFQGFRTIIFNSLAIVASWLGSNCNLPISEEHLTAITTTLIALVNIGLRVITKTPICKKEEVGKITHHKFDKL